MQALRALRLAAVPVKAVLVAGPGCDTSGWPEDMARVVDSEGLLARRYDALSGTCLLYTSFRFRQNGLRKFGKLGV